MKFYILGELRAYTDTGDRVVLPRRKPRLLLAMLLLRNGRTVSLNELTTALWQDAPPPSARANLHAYVSTLRRQLGNALLTTAQDGYRLAVEAEDLDAALFERFVAEARTAARAGRQWDAMRDFNAAMNLWQGDILETLELTEPLRDEAVRLRELRLSAEDELMDTHLATGDQVDTVAQFKRLVRAEPFREQRWARLMIALHRCGRTKEALETYQELHGFLTSELGVGPGEELRELHGRLLAEAGVETDMETAARAAAGWSATPPQHPWHGVRPHITVVGREREHAELTDLTLHGRLVTVTGPGGCGKSALALATARALATHFPNGVSVIGPAGVGNTSLDALADHDIGGQTLFVLDDCERLPGSAILARRLLSQPGSTVLATSRTPLRISEEVTWPLGPLPTPVVDEETPATSLFMQRAAQATPGFRVSAGQRTLVAEICRHLDGLPLAIELAAARLRVLSLRELADRLDAGLHCLLDPTFDVSPQHETLTSVFAWAYDRLSMQEKQLLRQLAEREGEFALADVEAAAAPHLCAADTLQVLAALVDQSFVQSQSTPRGRRFRLLTPVRAFVSQMVAGEHALEDTR